jgi:hypothetical protein|eukprot:COSAG06_NODE_1641_length_8829_cov_23.966667_3_plen_64_part_00
MDAGGDGNGLLDVDELLTLADKLKMRIPGKVRKSSLCVTAAFGCSDLYVLSGGSCLLERVQQR